MSGPDYIRVTCNRCGKIIAEGYEDEVMDMPCGCAEEHIRTLETMTKKIIHCLKCGSTWYDDGFTTECLQCRVRKLEEENRNHKQTLAGIAAMNPAEEGDRAIQWAKDGLSGYTMSADATVKCLQDKVGKLEKENKVLSLKARSTLANNLCPDHRDKQAGKPCLACEVERLKREKDAQGRRHGESMAKGERLETELTKAQEEAARLNRIIREADTNRAHLGSPVVYGNFDLELNYIPPPELPNIPAITREQDRLRSEVRRLREHKRDIYEYERTIKRYEERTHRLEARLVLAQEARADLVRRVEELDKQGRWLNRDALLARIHSIVKEGKQ